MNARANRDSYDFVTSNCADFVREVLNFYYPKSESRGKIADLFVSTPKRAAKSLVKYAQRHPDLEFTRFVIPQVPGTVKRSRPVHGVLESVFRANKYVAALAAFHPVIVGGVASAYVVGDRFNPASHADVFNIEGKLERAPGSLDRRSYAKQLRKMIEAESKANEASGAVSWRRFVRQAQPQLDALGHGRLEVVSGDEVTDVAVTRAGLTRDSGRFDE